MLSSMLLGLAPAVLRRASAVNSQVGLSAVAHRGGVGAFAFRSPSPLLAHSPMRWKHRGRSGSGEGAGDGTMAPEFLDPCAAVTAPSCNQASSVVVDITSPEFLAELKDEINVLQVDLAALDEKNSCIAEPSGPPATTTVSFDDTAIAGGPAGAASDDMLSFLIALRTSDETRKASLAGILQSQTQRDIHMQFPLTPNHHPLLADDFAMLPPFTAPPPPAEAAAASLPPIDTPVGPSVLSLEPSKITELVAGAHPLYWFILGPRKQAAAEQPAVTPHASAISPADRDALQLAAQVLDRTMEQLDRAQTFWMTSVLRKRRKKMNKHKLRKLRKRTQSQRK